MLVMFPSPRFAARLALSGILLGAPSVSCAAEAALPNRLDQHFDGVLGTSLDLTIYADDMERMEQAAAAALAEIARLERILSTWIDDSELMQLNRAHITNEASDDLLAVVSHCEDWFVRSSGLFVIEIDRGNRVKESSEVNNVRRVLLVGAGGAR